MCPCVPECFVFVSSLGVTMPMLAGWVGGDDLNCDLDGPGVCLKGKSPNLLPSFCCFLQGRITSSNLPVPPLLSQEFQYTAARLSPLLSVSAGSRPC